MKTSLLALAVLLSSLVSAQTSKPVIQTFYQPTYVTAFIPCLNHGKGENVTFSDTLTTVFWYTVTAGKRNGFIMFASTGGMHGKGQTTGISYTAHGSTQNGFANWVPTNPDGTTDGEGQFTYTDNYHISSSSPPDNHVWHRTQRFSVTKTGNVYTSQDQPDEVMCQ